MFVKVKNKYFFLMQKRFICLLIHLKKEVDVANLKNKHKLNGKLILKSPITGIFANV